jgi:hypothetical protein
VTLWFEAELIIHREPQLLFVPAIAFGRLDRDMPEQELDLFGFAATSVTATLIQPS